MFNCGSRAPTIYQDDKGAFQNRQKWVSRLTNLSEQVFTKLYATSLVKISYFWTYFRERGDSRGEVRKPFETP